MTDSPEDIARQATRFYHWCEALETSPRALAVVQESLSTTVIEAKAFGGPPWKRVFDTVLSVYARHLEPQAALDFVRDHHTDRQEPRVMVLLAVLGKLFDRALELERLTTANEVLGLFKADAVRAGLAGWELQALDGQHPFLEHQYHLATKNYAAAAAYFEQVPRSADLQTQLARVTLLMGDTARTLRELETAYRLDPRIRTQVEQLSPEPLRSFTQSPEYRAAFPSTLPSDEVLRRAYQLAEDAPFEAFVLVRDRLQDVGDRLDALGLQVFCLSRICSDLDEHGDANLPLYGGATTVGEFFRLNTEARQTLDQLRQETRRDVPCWLHFGWHPER